MKRFSLIIVLLLASSAGAQDTIEMTGIVRDFHQAHADFEVSPSEGYSHVTGNVPTTIVVGTDPTFVGPGQ